jgi:nicotinate dehydrogenase subunit A
MAETYRIRVNGASHEVRAEPDTPLLYVLRNDLELNGPKFGCGLSQCGACTVILGQEAVRACVTPIETVGASPILTLEGIGSIEQPHPLQRAFLAEQAAQCGYCANGMIMTAKALLDRKRAAGDAEIRDALAGNLCRCGTHVRILRAIKRAQKEMPA